MAFNYLVLIVLIIELTSVISQNRPNIVFIVIDDLGWNDVGFHGSNQILTPNIDALAYSGVILNRYYVQPICTPSRSALMTGKHPIHTGMQHDVLNAFEARGLPLKEKLLPQYLKELNYSTHAVGKWHLGFYKKEYTPTFRGFDSHFGYWSGNHDYNDHTAMLIGMWGLDMRRGLDPSWELHGQYSTDLFTNEAVSIIKSHDKSSPLFLYLAHVAVHSANFYNPLPAPDNLVAQFDNITDYSRRRFAAILSKVDDSVGKVVRALQKRDMLSNTVIIFTTDNGGPAAGFNSNAASNWPLRGVKYTLWEGGVRGAGFLWTSSIKPTVSLEKIHISDWLPTLLTAAKYNKKISNIDGVDAWETITEGKPSKRESILHNIDPIDHTAALTIGDWKIISGSGTYGNWNSWYGPSGRDPNLKYDTAKIIDSPVGQAMRSIGKPLYSSMIWGLRSKADISCGVERNLTLCDPKIKPCLFNIKEDPCEIDNLADILPSYVQDLLNELAKYNATAIPPSNLPVDPASNPIYWDHTWTNFGDYPSPIPTTTTTSTTSKAILSIKGRYLELN